MPAEHLMLHGNRGRLLSHLDVGKQLEPGRRYVFKLRAETRPGKGHFCAFKVWPEGRPEPRVWDLTGQEGPEEPGAGSVLLIAHYVDATFGDVRVRPCRSAKDVRQRNVV